MREKRQSVYASIARGILFVLIVTSVSHALVLCEYGNEKEAVIASVYNRYKTQCDTFGGGGSKFYGSYSKVVKCIDAAGIEHVDSLDGVWQTVVGCNTCESKEIVIEVEDFKNACAEKCMLTDYQCVWQNGEWGGSLGAFPKVCSKIDSTATGAKKMRNEECIIRNSECGIVS